MKRRSAPHSYPTDPAAGGPPSAGAALEVSPVGPVGRHGRGQLLRILGVTFGVAVGVGSTIGAGILRTPSLVADHVQTPTLILLVWAVGAVYCLLVANVMAELAAMVPRAGGAYVYIQRAFGGYAGFVFGWGDWAINCGALAFLAVTFAEFLQHLTDESLSSIPVVAVSLIALLTLLQLIGIRVGSHVQKGLSLLKVAGFLGVAVVCLLVSPTEVASRGISEASSVEPSFLLAVAGFFLAWQIVQESYAGWDGVAYFSEENADPGRSLPRALFGTVLIVAAVYLTLIVAQLHVLGPVEMAGSKLPLAEAADRVIGADSRYWVTVLALVTVLGTMNSIVLGAPRILYSISRDGLFISRGTGVSRLGTPTVVLLVTGGLAMLLTATGGFESLFTMVAFVGVSIQAAYILAFFVLRHREPALPRPYRARLHPWLPGLALAATLCLAVGSLAANPESALRGAALVALAYPAYLLLRRRGAVPRATDRAKDPALGRERP